MELWEILDDNGNPTGEIMKKYDKKVFDRIIPFRCRCVDIKVQYK